MIPLGPVVTRARIRAPRTMVWAALTSRGARETWWPQLSVTPEAGGQISDLRPVNAPSGGLADPEPGAAHNEDPRNVEHARWTGEIDVWVEGHALGFRWAEVADAQSAPAGSTAVLVTLRSQGVDTGITVTETGFDALEAPAAKSADALAAWQGVLSQLMEAVDSGALQEALATPAEESAVNEDPAVDKDPAADEDPSANEDPDAGQTADLTEPSQTEPAGVETEELEAAADDVEVTIVDHDVTGDEAEAEGETAADDTEQLTPLVLPGPPPGYQPRPQYRDFDSVIRGD